MTRSELWEDVKFSLCFAVPVRFVERTTRRTHTSQLNDELFRSVWDEPMQKTWWQWRGRQWGVRYRSLALTDRTTEADRVEEYEAMRADGYSDAEAREQAWPA